MTFTENKTCFVSGEGKSGSLTGITKDDNSNMKRRLVILAHPSKLAPVVAQSSISRFVDILRPCVDKVILLSGVAPLSANGEKGETQYKHIRVRKPMDRDKMFILLKVLDYLLTDLTFCYHLARLHGVFDGVVFHISMKGYPLSPVATKLLRKKLVIFSFNSLIRLAQAQRQERAAIREEVLPPSILNLLEKLNFSLADRIWVESESVIKFSHLEKYQGKISVLNSSYVDLESFTIKKPIQERGNTIGFIGRFTEQKGILNLCKAIPRIKVRCDNTRVVLVGDGPLKERIEGELKKANSLTECEIAGWVANDALPAYLNGMKLLVLPSYTEGLPKVVQEAMACGTVVVATPVGGVPDLIKDEESGFILDDNSPECIADTVIRALTHPNLEEIARNARKVIEKVGGYETVVEQCRNALGKLFNQRIVEIRRR